MKKSTTFAAIALLGAVAAFASDPMVGGSKMFPTKNIVENAINSKDHTTLVAADQGRGTGGYVGRSRTLHRVCAHQ